MRIGIISDTHDQRPRTLAAVQLLMAEGAEVLIHCGDLVHPSLVSACASLPSYFVFGNNDIAYADEIRTAIADLQNGVCLEWSAEIELGGKRIAIAHGHRMNDVRRLLAAGPDYMFSGHSHVAGDWCAGETRRINPGALHRASQFSVALLNLENDELRFLNVPRT
jgi:uncharacterized protein